MIDKFIDSAGTASLTRQDTQETKESGSAEFFAGEEEFSKGNYERALKHYLNASGMPLRIFYCYRASAHLSHQREEKERALAFCQKALTLVSEDQVTLRLLDLLQNPESAPSTGSSDELQQPRVTEEVE